MGEEERKIAGYRYQLLSQIVSECSPQMLRCSDAQMDETAEAEGDHQEKA